MTFFGITFLEDIDLPEFPFPDLGVLGDEEELRPSELGSGRRPTVSDGGARCERTPEECLH